MPIQNVNGRNVYVITPSRPDQRTSTGQSYSQFFSQLRWQVWEAYQADELQRMRSEGADAASLQALYDKNRAELQRQLAAKEKALLAFERGEAGNKQVIENIIARESARNLDRNIGEENKYQRDRAGKVTISGAPSVPEGQSGSNMGVIFQDRVNYGKGDVTIDEKTGEPVFQDTSSSLSGTRSSTFTQVAPRETRTTKEGLSQPLSRPTKPEEIRAIIEGKATWDARRGVLVPIEGAEATGGVETAGSDAKQKLQQEIDALRQQLGGMTRPAGPQDGRTLLERTRARYEQDVGRGGLFGLTPEARQPQMGPDVVGRFPAPKAKAPSTFEAPEPTFEQAVYGAEYNKEDRVVPGLERNAPSDLAKPVGYERQPYVEGMSGPETIRARTPGQMDVPSYEPSGPGMTAVEGRTGLPPEAPTTRLPESELFRQMLGEADMLPQQPPVAPNGIPYQTTAPIAETPKEEFNLGGGVVEQPQGIPPEIMQQMPKLPAAAPEKPPVSLPSAQQQFLDQLGQKAPQSQLDLFRSLFPGEELKPATSQAEAPQPTRSQRADAYAVRIAQKGLEQARTSPKKVESQKTTGPEEVRIAAQVYEVNKGNMKKSFDEISRVYADQPTKRQRAQQYLVALDTLNSDRMNPV